MKNNIYPPKLPLEQFLFLVNITNFIGFIGKYYQYGEILPKSRKAIFTSLGGNCFVGYFKFLGCGIETAALFERLGNNAFFVFLPWQHRTVRFEPLHLAVGGLTFDIRR